MGEVRTSATQLGELVRVEQPKGAAARRWGVARVRMLAMSARSRQLRRWDEITA